MNVWCKFGFHAWKGLGKIIGFHEPTWSVYYAERSTFRRCARCTRLERFNCIAMRYMDKKEWKEYCEAKGLPYHAGTPSFDNNLRSIFTISKHAKHYPNPKIKTTLESKTVRKMYGCG